MFVPLFADFSQLRCLTSLGLVVLIDSYWNRPAHIYVEAFVAALSCILKQAAKADQLSHITFRFKFYRDDDEVMQPILHTIDDILSEATFIKVKSVHISFVPRYLHLVDDEMVSVVDTVGDSLPHSLRRGIVKLFIQ